MFVFKFLEYFILSAIYIHVVKKNMIIIMLADLCHLVFRLSRSKINCYFYPFFIHQIILEARQLFRVHVLK